MPNSISAMPMAMSLTRGNEHISPWISPNSAPASGALNDAATAAATPQPNSVRLSERVSCRRRASHAPSDAPRCTAGPSRPTDAPAPIDSALAMAEYRPTRDDIQPPCSCSASITSATPWGFRLGRKK